MTEWLTAYITRLFVAGMVCSFVILISGKGVFREPIRLSCACFMILVMLSDLPDGKDSLRHMISAFEDARREIEAVVDDALTDTQKEIGRKTADRLSELLHKNGFICDVNTEINTLGAVERIYIKGYNGEKDRLTDFVCSMIGMKRDNIIFEGGTDG